MSFTRFRAGAFLVASSVLLTAPGCGGESAATFGGYTSSSAGSSGGGSGGTGPTSGAGGSSSSSSTSGGGSPTTSSSTTDSAATAFDPNEDGPYAYTEIDVSTKVASTNNTVPLHVAYPTAGPGAGPYPVVVIAHGFQLPASQYASFVRRLASFGYVAINADYSAGFVPDHVENAKDLIGAIDWAASAPELAGKADTTAVGMTGHSLGGKVTLLAATMDARVKASIALDPVDTLPLGCSAQKCPDVSEKLPIGIPTGFLGETTDSQGGLQQCAPAPDNYQTFYAQAASPSLSVTVNGANHMSFIDDVGSCGLTCSACKAASAPNAQVNAMARAYVVAFYERYLRGNASYDTYLTGAEAKARYVDTSQATIASK